MVGHQVGAMSRDADLESYRKTVVAFVDREVAPNAATWDRVERMDRGIAAGPWGI